VAGIAAGLFVTFLMGRTLSKPIRRLTEGALRATGGDLTSKIEVDTHDEIGQLASSFNKMTDELNILIQKEKETAAAAKNRSEELERAYKEKGAAEKDAKDAYARLKETQGQLIQAEKLNAVGQLASGVAHEVKNPLGIVLQGIHYLESSLKHEDDTALKVFDTMKNNIKRADDIIRSLVDFSRASEIRIGPEDINPIIESSLQLIQHRVILADIEIIRELKEDLPKALLDKAKMEQVFVNLFLNAIQVMPKGGKLFIRSYATKLKDIRNGVGRRGQDLFKQGEEALVVEVEDTGEGISEEDLKRIFEPFFSTKGPRGGAGLGLPVSKNIIDMHRGLIDMVSKKDAGTKVIICLKIAQGL
jgi:signal transduction histidine kinase